LLGNKAITKIKIMTNLKTATANDFKIGTVLISSEGYQFKLISKYDNGVWECKNRIHVESEAKFYKVAL